MKTLITLILVATSFSLKIYAQEEKGCDGPLHESIIEAKLYSVDGDEKPDERCISFFQFQHLSFHFDFNSHPESDKANWVFYVEEGEKLVVESKFASESIQCQDAAGFITVHSGELPNLQKSQYTKYNAGETHTGYTYTLEITDAVEFEIDSPTYTDTVKITVKIIEPIESISTELPFVSQVGNSNEVIITTNSELTEEINVFTVSGDLIKRFRIDDGQKIQLTELPKGIYLLQADVNGDLITGKYVQF